MTFRLPALSVASAATVLIAGVVWAQDAPADRVVLTADGVAVTESDVMRAIQNLPPQLQQLPPQMLLPQIADQLAIGVLIANQAEVDGLAEDPDVVTRLERARRSVLQGVWLERRLEAEITPSVLEGAYRDYLAANPAEDEVSARHILVESEDEAAAIIDRLAGGADFAALAEELSIGPSGPNGGDLGFFSQGQMVAPFAEAAFALEPGSFTDAPVQTQFGWHVILVEDRRTTPQPSLEEVEGELRQTLEGEILQGIFDDLRADAEIIYYDADGNPIEDAQAPVVQ